MSLLHCCLALSLAWPALAGAESLRCEGGTVSEGDSRLSLAYKCGEPKLRDAYCSPVYYPGTLEVMPDTYALRVVPCLEVEEWLYERGPGRLVVTVFLRSGVVRAISYGRVPQ